jgi:DNA-binding NarL/FixJ family response regulator
LDDLVNEKMQQNHEFSLSKNQLSILKLLKHGYANLEIANSLSISHNAVKANIRMMYHLLGAKNRMECLSIAKRSGLL